MRLSSAKYASRSAPLSTRAAPRTSRATRPREPLRAARVARAAFLTGRAARPRERLRAAPQRYLGTCRLSGVSLWYANPRRAHLKHLQSGAFMLSGSLCAGAFRLCCEVHVRFFPYHAQGSSASVARRLSHLACSQFSFCDGDVCSATCSDALRLRRGLTQAYVNLQAILSIDTLINCQRVHSVTVV